ncbi:heme exporter protein CcmB [Marinomonas sp. M1K-6]|uniref:Heme exporter protein B n=1 Tax=Marinomonas profundi TaxID=2726122 RepID=A0A847R3M9_9GAMM|nr:heme exporter protein CcmB [Marinomonas profundi]NLQ16566.1 heme exporter protein CcmB [Marinomonas profundi]UDV03847.1 heme exporter protein CcmB [Marinomonas profundi]
MTYYSFLTAECLVLWRRKQDVFNALMFFVIVIALFPIGINSSPEFLAPAAAGIIWCAAVLAILMAVEGMFKEDYRDGSLEQLVVSGLSLPLLILLKVAAQWFVVVLPLLIIMPLLSEMLYLPRSGFWVLMMTLLLGTPSLFLIGVMGAALTVSLRQGAVLVMLLILPLYLPVIIFATLAVQAAQIGLPYAGLLAMLSALSLLFLVISPFIAAIAVKASVN